MFLFVPTLDDRSSFVRWLHDIWQHCSNVRDEKRRPGILLVFSTLPDVLPGGNVFRYCLRHVPFSRLFSVLIDFVLYCRLPWMSGAWRERYDTCLIMWRRWYKLCIDALCYLWYSLSMKNRVWCDHLLSIWPQALVSSNQPIALKYCIIRIALTETCLHLMTLQ